MVIAVCMVAGFTAGYLFGEREPQTIRLERAEMRQEMRDANWKKCQKVDSKGQSGNKIEELWDCKGTKFFVIKRMDIVELDPSIIPNQ